MNILYGVQATGNGHINRSREVVKELKKNNQVEVIFSGREESKIKNVEDFKPYRVYKGITYKTKNGNIDYIETIKDLGLIEFNKNIYDYNGNHDLIITDFEPITCKISQKSKIPSIGLAHQYNLVQEVIPSFITKIFAPADIEIGINWWHFNNNIIPPILPKNLKSNTIKNKILVYLPWHDYNVYKKLNIYKEYNFVCYDPRVDNVTYMDNVIINPIDRKNFIEDLQSCEGVLANAGFQLSSEAISLSKKLFVIPLKGQFEQELNAKNLQLLNLGMSANDIDSSLFEFWLKKEQDYRNNIWNNLVVEEFVRWIENGYEDLTSFIKSIW
ncbi:MAG: glycosyltransferase family protein [Bacillota bacterium]